MPEVYGTPAWYDLNQVILSRDNMTKLKVTAITN